MRKTFTFFVLLISFISPKALHSTNHTNTGGNQLYFLGTGDTLTLQSGIFTGAVLYFDYGAVIRVQSSASFRPWYILNPEGKIFIYGSATINFEFDARNNFELHNYGTLTMQQDVTIDSDNEVWFNYQTGIIRFEDVVNMAGEARFTNEGSVRALSAITIDDEAEFRNRSAFVGDNNLTISTDAFLNEGSLSIRGTFSVASDASLVNNCRMMIDGSFTNSSTSFQNYGLIWAGRAGSATATFTNTGNIAMRPNSAIRSVRFINSGTITGRGKMYFSGHTQNNGIIGVNGATADSLIMYDVTRTAAPNMFDVQTVNPRPNVVFRSFPAPDTVTFYSGCGMTAAGYVALPIEWLYFNARSEKNDVTLSWGSEFDHGTMFQVERSYDGINYSAISIVLTATGLTNYQYIDRGVSTSAGLVYYRIKGISPVSGEKLSATRMIKFGAAAPKAVVQASPNPFTSQFNLNFESATRETVSIRVYSISGSIELHKSILANKGFNSIKVSELANLAKGMYVIEIRNENGIVGTQKIVKQ